MKSIDLAQPDHPATQALRAVIAKARTVVCLTGAGVSAESGIATFRDAGGLWQKHRPEELASPAGFARDPALVWEWYNERRKSILASRPNPGHEAIARLEALFPRFTLITQNVDGLHRQAGSRQLLEIHGSIWQLRCTRESRIWEDRSLFDSFPVYCPCGALARPNVLWFGENYDYRLMEQVFQAVGEASLFLVAGTSGAVSIVPQLLSHAEAAWSVEFNREPSAITHSMDFFIQGPSGQTLPLFGQIAQGIRDSAAPRPRQNTHGDAGLCDREPETETDYGHA